MLLPQTFYSQVKDLFCKAFKNHIIVYEQNFPKGNCPFYYESAADFFRESVHYSWVIFVYISLLNSICFNFLQPHDNCLTSLGYYNSLNSVFEFSIINPCRPIFLHCMCLKLKSHTLLLSEHQIQCLGFHVGGRSWQTRRDLAKLFRVNSNSRSFLSQYCRY